MKNEWIVETVWYYNDYRRSDPKMLDDSLYPPHLWTFFYIICILMIVKELTSESNCAYISSRYLLFNAIR